MRVLVEDLRELIHRHRRAFVGLHLAFVAMFALGVLATVAVPDLRPGGLGALDGGDGATGLGSVIADAYRSGDVLRAAAVTLVVNLVFASILQTTLPTLVVPYLGVALTLVRGLSWGVLFTPVGADDATFLVHWVTLVIEGSAYVCVAFAAWVHGGYVLRARHHGFENRRAGYVAGLRVTAQVYALVLALLVVGALYEAVTVIHLIA